MLSCVGSGSIDGSSAGRFDDIPTERQSEGKSITGRNAQVCCKWTESVAILHGHGFELARCGQSPGVTQFHLPRAPQNDWGMGVPCGSPRGGDRRGPGANDFEGSDRFWIRGTRIPEGRRNPWRSRPRGRRSASGDLSHWVGDSNPLWRKGCCGDSFGLRRRLDTVLHPKTQNESRNLDSYVDDVRRLHLPLPSLGRGDGPKTQSVPRDLASYGPPVTLETRSPGLPP